MLLKNKFFEFLFRKIRLEPIYSMRINLKNLFTKENVLVCTKQSCEALLHIDFFFQVQICRS